MVCINCGSPTKVFNSRLQKRPNQVWRRRRCDTCGLLFSSHEIALYESAWLVKDTAGLLNPFSRDQLFLSLYRSCEHRSTALEDARALTETIIGRLQQKTQSGVLGTNTIVQVAHIALNRFDSAASTHYQAYHA